MKKKLRGGVATTSANTPTPGTPIKNNFMGSKIQKQAANKYQVMDPQYHKKQLKIINDMEEKKAMSLIQKGASTTLHKN